jgi:hypothetical protein
MELAFMSDRVYTTFLENTLTQALALADESDILQVLPLPPLPPSRYLCQFKLPFLRRVPSGEVVVAGGPVLAGLHFPEDYLHSAEPPLHLKVAAVLTTDLGGVPGQRLRFGHSHSRSALGTL